MQLLCISKSNMFLLDSKTGKTKALQSQALDRYRKNSDYIRHKNDWKKKDEQALVMQMMNQATEPAESAAIKGAAVDKESKSVFYTIYIENFTGLYEKHDLAENTEGIVLSDMNKSFCELDLSDKKIILTIASGGFEKHLAVIERGKAGYSFLTEGDSVEDSPVWSRKEEDVVFYSSAGLCHNGGVIRGPFALCKLNLSSYEMDEILCGEDMDYVKPKENSKGTLYFIRRPYRDKKSKNYTLADVFTAPLKIIKAFIEWLNFFSQRYTGQPLNSGGSDVKSKNKSEQQVFIEGNLVDAEKAMKENSMRGEKYPGLAPRSWELCRLENDKKITVIRKGVLDYCIGEDDTIVYSNGKHLLTISPDGKEIYISPADLVTKLIIL